MTLAQKLGLKKTVYPTANIIRSVGCRAVTNVTALAMPGRSS
jgi:hypothetical protein